MTTEVYVDKGICIRRISLDLARGPGYEILTPSEGVKMTRAEFRFMVLTLVKHLMERWK